MRTTTMAVADIPLTVGGKSWREVSKECTFNDSVTRGSEPSHGMNLSTDCRKPCVRWSLWHAIIVAVVVGVGVSNTQAAWTGDNLISFAGWAESKYCNWVSASHRYVNWPYGLGYSGGSVLPNGYHFHAWHMASKTVTVVPGKRYAYAVTAKDNTSFYGTPVQGYAGWRTAVVGYGSTGAFGQNSYQTSTITFIPAESSVELQAKHEVDVSGGNQTSEVRTPCATFQSVQLNQVVYAPQLAIATHTIRVNSTLPAQSDADVSLGVSSLSYADDPTSWSLDWGDGATESNPTLGSNRSHTYSITSGNSQSFPVLFSGSNQSGSGQDAATITILRQPEIALTVNDIPVLPGSTIDIEAGSPLRMSLLNSLGFIENASFAIPQKLDQASSDMSYSGILFGKADIGQVFSLTTGISNTGAGTNSDSSAVKLRIVPEPATLSFLALGGVAMLRRKRE
jgi:hypothetical protein